MDIVVVTALGISVGGSVAILIGYLTRRTDARFRFPLLSMGSTLTLGQLFLLRTGRVTEPVQTLFLGGCVLLSLVFLAAGMVELRRAARAARRRFDALGTFKPGDERTRRVGTCLGT